MKAHFYIYIAEGGRTFQGDVVIEESALTISQKISNCAVESQHFQRHLFSQFIQIIKTFNELFKSQMNIKADVIKQRTIEIQIHDHITGFDPTL